MIFDYIILGIVVVCLIMFLLQGVMLLLLRRDQRDISKSIQEAKSLAIEEFSNSNSQAWRLYEYLNTRIEGISEELDEIKIQVGIIKGCMGHPIQMPYSGAKRGPKPKQLVEHEQ